MQLTRDDDEGLSLSLILGLSWGPKPQAKPDIKPDPNTYTTTPINPN